MAKRLPVPKELEHLMEKRETTDRRQKQRRDTETSAGGTIERREKTDRRSGSRRKADK